MKNLLFLIAIIISIPCYSQNFGIKYGFVLSKTNSSFYTDPMQSYMFGGFYNYKATANVSLQGELIFSNRGGYSEETNRQLSQKYFDIPLQAKFSLNEKTVTPYFMAGLSPSFLVSSRDNKIGKMHSSAVNGSGIFSLGIDCKATEKTKIVFEARYWAGLDFSAFSFSAGLRF